MSDRARRFSFASRASLGKRKLVEEEPEREFIDLEEELPVSQSKRSKRGAACRPSDDLSGLFPIPHRSDADNAIRLYADMNAQGIAALLRVRDNLRVLEEELVDGTCRCAVDIPEDISQLNALGAELVRINSSRFAEGFIGSEAKRKSGEIRNAGTAHMVTLLREICRLVEIVAPRIGSCDLHGGDAELLRDGTRAWCAYADGMVERYGVDIMKAEL